MKAQSSTNQKLSGMASIEILIAFTVLSLSLGAIILITFRNQSIVESNSMSSSALSMALETIEEVRGLATFDFNLVQPIVKTTDGTYERSLEATQIDPFTKQATSTVSWNEYGLSLHVSLSTLLTNPLGYLNGDSCNSIYIDKESWKNPTASTWDFGELGVNGGNGNGFGIGGLSVSNQRLYIGLDAVPSSNKNTIYIFDLPTSSGQKPVYRGATTTAALVSAIAISRNYAFVATKSTVSQLQVIDISDPTKPTIVASRKVTGSSGLGNAIHYHNNKIYLGLTANTSGAELAVFDVSSSTNPILISNGMYEVGHDVNSIVTRGNYAYIATPSSESMTILDILPSSKTFMQRIGGFTSSFYPPDLNGVGSNYGESMFLLGNTMYFGRTYGTNEFYALNISNPTNVLTLGNLNVVVNPNNKNSIYGISVKGDLAFFITKAQFQVWDVSNINSIKPWSQDSTTNTFLSLASLGGSGGPSYCSGDFMYLGILTPSTNRKDMLSIISASPNP